jgi:hypothetical protein
MAAPRRLHCNARGANGTIQTSTGLMQEKTGLIIDKQNNPIVHETVYPSSTSLLHIPTS